MQHTISGDKRLRKPTVASCPAKRRLAAFFTGTAMLGTLAGCAGGGSPELVYAPQANQRYALTVSLVEGEGGGRIESKVESVVLAHVKEQRWTTTVENMTTSIREGTGPWEVLPTSTQQTEEAKDWIDRYGYRDGCFSSVFVWNGEVPLPRRPVSVGDTWTVRPNVRFAHPKVASVKADAHCPAQPPEKFRELLKTDEEPVSPATKCTLLSETSAEWTIQCTTRMEFQNGRKALKLHATLSKADGYSGERRLVTTTTIPNMGSRESVMLVTIRPKAE